MSNLVLKREWLKPSLHIPDFLTCRHIWNDAFDFLERYKDRKVTEFASHTEAAQVLLSLIEGMNGVEVIQAGHSFVYKEFMGRHIYRASIISHEEFLAYLDGLRR